MITVVRAPFATTVQDLGRPGHRHVGVPVSGAMDRDALVATNVCVGNVAGAAALEMALGGGELRFEDDTVIATGGARLVAMPGERALAPWIPVRVRAGDVLRIERVTDGQFAYIAVRGGIDVPLVLGSRSTLVSAALGGHEGRLLRVGDVLQVGEQVGGGPGPVPAVDHDATRPIPIVRGPQGAELDDAAWRTLLDSDFTVSRASNRAGYRLEGPTIAHRVATDRPSEPTCIGAIQLPSGGAPIVLMQDGPTIGGYPKIAVVREKAIGMFAQRTPGSSVRFVLDE